METKEFMGLTYCKAEGQMMFNVIKDGAGETFVRTLQKLINRERYDIDVKGSLADRKSLRDQGIYISPQSVPLKYADRLRVYITEKRYQPSPYTDTDGTLQAKIINLQRELEEEAACLAEKTAECEQWKNTTALQREQIIDYRNALQDRDNDITDLKEQLRKLRFAGATPEQLELIEKYDGSEIVLFARSMYRMNPEKLKAVKAFKDGSGLSLRDAKDVCDYLVFQ